MSTTVQYKDTPSDICKLCKDVITEMKAIDPCVLDVTALTALMDYMIVVTGSSSQHVRSIAEHLRVTLKANQIQILGIEGMKEGEWVLIDSGDVVVHVMQAKTREYYEVEKLWSVSECESA